MNHKEAARKYQQYLEGSLKGKRREDFEAHLEGCQTCRAELEALRRLDTRLRQGVRAYWESVEPPADLVAGQDEDEQ